MTSATASDFSGWTVGRGIDVGNEGAVNHHRPDRAATSFQDIGTPGINSSGSSAIGSNIGLGGCATGGGTTNLTITNNDISDIQDSRAILVDESQDTTGGGPFPTVFVNISGNTIGGFIGGQAGDGSRIRLRSGRTAPSEVTQGAPGSSVSLVCCKHRLSQPLKSALAAQFRSTRAPRRCRRQSIPLPLLAADGGIPAGSGQSGDHDLTTAELGGIVEAAIARWVATGLSEEQLAALDGLTFATADLGGANLGSYMAGLVLMDNDAAGHGWFVDATPFDDAEFGHVVSATQLQTDLSGPPAGQMDLLTLVMHEIGHVLGLDHAEDSSAGDLMSDHLVTGERRLPSAADVAAASEHNHAASQQGAISENAVVSGTDTFVGQNIVDGFDAEYYLLHNPDVAAAGVDPHVHFDTFGWHEGRNPNAYFDTAGYLAHYADVAAAGVDPLLALRDVRLEGRPRSVGAASTRSGYLAANPDVAAAHVNPLDHFLQFGVHEGRSPESDGIWG